MLRSRRWKLAIDKQDVSYMLYDLKNDPEEQHNLAADPAAELLRLKLRKRLASTLARL